MDSRIKKRIERTSGFPFSEFPAEGVVVRVSGARTDEPKNRLLVERIEGNPGVLVTGIPRIIDTVGECVKSMTGDELFSPPGTAGIKRVLPPEDAESLDEIYGRNCAITEPGDFHPVKPRHRVTALGKTDIPAVQNDLRMGERRTSEKGDFTWAFACFDDTPGFSATELAEFGKNCAAISVIFWEDDDIAGFGVYTEEYFRRQGYALDTVSAATQWVLEQGAVAWYGAYADNIPSLRTARRLGYSPVYRSFGA